MMPHRKLDTANRLLQGICRKADTPQACALARAIVSMLHGCSNPTALVAIACAVAAQAHPQADEELGDAIVDAVAMLARIILDQHREGVDADEMAERIKAGSATAGSA